MMLPIRKRLTPEILADENPVTTWIDNNPALCFDAMHEACWRLAENQELKEVVVFQLYTPGAAYSVFGFSNANLFAEISIDRENWRETLDECQEWFVLSEEYEKAARVVECRKNLENHKS